MAVPLPFPANPSRDERNPQGTRRTEEERRAADGALRVKGIFFSGTDTSVGKTVVTAAVARCLRRQGRPVRVCKPVATGAEAVAGRWVSEDTRRLAEAAGLEGELERVTPWTFPVPAAPPVAARLAGTS